MSDDLIDGDDPDPDADAGGEPFERVEEGGFYGWNPQTVAAWQSDEDGEIVAVERGVTHGKRFTVTRFAAPIWEETEPLEYHGSTDDEGTARRTAKGVLRGKVDGDE